MSFRIDLRRRHGLRVVLVGVSAVGLIVGTFLIFLNGLVALPFDTALGISIAFAAACAAMIRALVDLLPRPAPGCSKCDRTTGDLETTKHETTKDDKSNSAGIHDGAQQCQPVSRRQRVSDA